jgi:hypothetical protein
MCVCVCVCVRRRVQGVEIIRVGDWDRFLVVARLELSFGDIEVLEERRCWVVFIVSKSKVPRESLDPLGQATPKAGEGMTRFPSLHLFVSSHNLDVLPLNLPQTHTMTRPNMPDSKPNPSRTKSKMQRLPKGAPLLPPLHLHSH